MSERPINLSGGRVVSIPLSAVWVGVVALVGIAGGLISFTSRLNGIDDQMRALATRQDGFTKLIDTASPISQQRELRIQSLERADAAMQERMGAMILTQNAATSETREQLRDISTQVRALASEFRASRPMQPTRAERLDSTPSTPVQP